MKQLDTTTVLAIIEMIDARLANLENTTMHIEDYLGADRALTELQNHLQSFIEGELNAAELNTGE